MRTVALMAVASLLAACETSSTAVEYDHPFFPLNVGDTRTYESTFFDDDIPPRKWTERVVRRVEVGEKVYYLFQSGQRNEYMRVGSGGKVWVYVPSLGIDELWLDLEAESGRAYRLIEWVDPMWRGELPDSLTVDVLVRRKGENVLGHSVASVAYFFDSKSLVDDEAEVVVSEGLGVTSFYRALGPFGKLVFARIGGTAYPRIGAAEAKSP